MIGLTFLAIGLLWLAFSIFVGRKLPRWLGIRNPAGQWAVTVAAVVVLLVGPFVDHIVGMRQFERLCEEARASVWVSPTIERTHRVKQAPVNFFNLKGYVIAIESAKTVYVDLDSEQPVLVFQNYFTTGGRVWGVTLMGGNMSCGTGKSEQVKEIWNKYAFARLIDEGKKK